VYRLVSEGCLKTLVSAPKCHCPKVLAVWPTCIRTIGEARANSAVECDSARLEVVVVDLDQVKVTPRDRQVLKLLVQGCSNKEIAGQLNISPRTVKQHLRTLFLRAGIRDGRKRVKLAIAMFDQEEAQS
jgi:FixJ family two-component response regulator